MTPAARPHLDYHELDDGGVIHDEAADRVHTLNTTAAYVWNCLDGSHSLEQIALDLREQFDSPLEIVLRDVREVVAHFQREGLLHS
jgi:hypothetical protein